MYSRGCHIKQQRRDRQKFTLATDPSQPESLFPDFRKVYQITLTSVLCLLVDLAYTPLLGGESQAEEMYWVPGIADSNMAFRITVVDAITNADRSDTHHSPLGIRTRITRMLSLTLTGELFAFLKKLAAE